jgi:TnpA family transposase
MDRTKTYRHIEPLLKGTINQELILSAWDDLIRVAGSLKRGWVTSSLFISRLQARPRQNALARALQEYGRLVKTNFILRYLLSEDYRRRINTQLNKGEALHALRLFLFFANQGLLRQHQPEDQANQASCLTLVTNAVMAWNMVYMTDAIANLEQSDMQSQRVISCISHQPYMLISIAMESIISRQCLPLINCHAAPYVSHLYSRLNVGFCPFATETPYTLSVKLACW